MTDAEIIALAVRYYKAGQASTAEVDGIPTRNERIAAMLVLAVRAGCVARVQVVPDPYTRKMVRREVTGTGRARTAARPVFLGWTVLDIARMLDGDRERAARLVDAAFERGFRKRHLDDWILRKPSEEDRHLWTLLTTEPTSVDDGGVRKARQRAVEWFRKQGRVIEAAPSPPVALTCGKLTAGSTTTKRTADGHLWRDDRGPCGNGAAAMNALTLTQPDHPGLTLALPRRTGAVIDGLTQAALDSADVAVGLPSFGELATQTTFGPSSVRLQASGLDRGTAHAVARWGSALYHLATRLPDARARAEHHSGKQARDLARRAAADRVDDMVVRSCVGQWGGLELATRVRDARMDRPDIEPEDNTEGRMARMEVHQLAARAHALLASPAGHQALTLAMRHDPTGWSETAVLLVGEGILTRKEMDRLTALTGRQWSDFID